MSDISVMYEHFFRDKPGLDNGQYENSCLFSVIAGHKPSHTALFVVDAIINSTRQAIHIAPWQYKFSSQTYSGGCTGEFSNKSQPIEDVGKAIFDKMLPWVSRTPVWISLDEKALGHKYYFRFAFQGKVITAKVVGPDVAQAEVFQAATSKTQSVLKTFGQMGKVPTQKVLIPSAPAGNSIFFTLRKYKKPK